MVGMTVICELVAGPCGPTRVAAAEGFEQLTFAGGEPHINVADPDRIDGRRYLIDLRCDSFDELGAAFVANDVLRRGHAAEVVLYCPYLPGARQDRAEHGAPLTAKVYADIINAAGFDRVVCIDPHSPVMPALLDRVAVIGAADVIDPAFLDGDGRPVVLICPDAGAAKRTEQIAERFALDVVYARKQRNPHTGGLDRFHCPPIDDETIAVVVDDICDGGGTFLGLADVLDRPAEVMRLWTSHGIYSRGLDLLSGRYSRIGSTDSFPSLHGHDPRLTRVTTMPALQAALTANPHRCRHDAGPKEMI